MVFSLFTLHADITTWTLSTPVIAQNNESDVSFSRFANECALPDYRLSRENTRGLRWKKVEFPSDVGNTDSANIYAEASNAELAAATKTLMRTSAK